MKYELYSHFLCQDMYNIWKSETLSELNLYQIHSELNHLGSEASIYSYNIVL